MKAILDRKRSATAVITASHTWAPATAESLAELLRPELAEGETLPDLELLQRLFGRALARRWRCLESSDQSHVKARERAGRHRGERASALAALYRRVVDLRRLLRGIFGAAPARRLLGLAGETSRDEVVLLRQAEQSTARLGDACRALPPACFTPAAGDRARWTAPVEAATETLRSAGARASRTIKEMEAAAADRRRALAAYNDVFARVAGWLECSYRAAGHDPYADLVRPSKRRPGRLLKDDLRGAGRRTAPEADRRQGMQVQGRRQGEDGGPSSALPAAA